MSNKQNDEFNEALREAEEELKYYASILGRKGGKIKSETKKKALKLNLVKARAARKALKDKANAL